MSLPPLSPNAWLRWSTVRRLLPPLDEGSSILEMGAGQGATGARLAARFRYTGVEPDTTSREVARTRLPEGARLLPSSAELRGEQFDLLCTFEVLEHVDTDCDTLTEWAELVRPGGHVVVSVPAGSQRFAAADRWVGHLRRYDRDDLVSLLTSAGLDVDRLALYGFPLGYVLEAGRNSVARRRLARDDTPIEQRTAASGRVLQPPSWAAVATRIATAPFRVLQRPFQQSLGTGWVAVAHRPTQ